MIAAVRSLWIWLTAIILIILWLPLLAVIRLFDRDPAKYRTGWWFRRLGRILTRINLAWTIHASGEKIENPRRPYVVVSNHQSLADIPIISNLPWEMKWVAKAELFRVPVVGWMMRIAGDIPLDRKDRRSGAMMLLSAHRYLQQMCSVMFFPEGTRSPDGRVHNFSEGAFHLAIKAQVPVLPIAVEGSRDCLPKHQWVFTEPQEIFLRVLPPIETPRMTLQEVPSLRDEVRRKIIRQIATWRGVEHANVDGLLPRSGDIRPRQPLHL